MYYVNYLASSSHSTNLQLLLVVHIDWHNPALQYLFIYLKKKRTGKENTKYVPNEALRHIS